MKPGIYQGLRFEEYLKDPCDTPSLSSGVARDLIDSSPLHAWTNHPRLNPDYEVDATKESDMGTACHAALLEGSSDCIAWVDYPDWRKGDAQKQRDEARSAGKVAMLTRQRKDMEAMLAKARADLRLSEFAGILNGDAERTVIWQEAGQRCRCRPDMMDDSERPLIMDYKTTGSADPEAFYRVVKSKGYDFKAEFYRRGFAKALGALPVFFWLVQERTPPYDCSIVSPGPQMEAIAAERVGRAIDLWARCMGSGVWPGRTKRTAYLEVKPWDVAAWENQAIEEVE